MGRKPGGNDGVPPDGDRTPDPELPELPPEWGEIIIPDDASALASEAEQVREELTRAQQQAAERARRGAGAGTGDTEPSIGVPLLIMSVAVLITLVSLFAMAWSGTSSIPPDTAGSRAGNGPAELPPMVLVDATGRIVALAAQTPIVIMLVEECECTGLISATVAAAPPGVTVAIVGYQAPPEPASLAPGDRAPLRLADPDGLVRNRLSLDRPNDTATVVLANRDRQITLVHPAATSVAQYQGALTDLAG
jgi:hypothetical protein